MAISCLVFWRRRVHRRRMIRFQRNGKGSPNVSAMDQGKSYPERGVSECIIAEEEELMPRRASKSRPATERRESQPPSQPDRLPVMHDSKQIQTSLMSLVDTNGPVTPTEPEKKVGSAGTGYAISLEESTLIPYCSSESSV